MSDNDIVRAWKDENFRNGLSSEEQAQLPANPAGIIDLSDDLLDKIVGGQELPLTHGTFCSIVAGGTCQLGTKGCCPSQINPPV